MQEIVLVIAGLAALYFGGTGLVSSAGRLALSLGISATVVAMTVVAIGTSLPELLVSVSAARQGNSALAFGNIIGSNIANIGLIMGLSTVIAPMLIDKKILRRELPLLMVATIGTFLLALDGQLSRLDGALLLTGFATFLGLSLMRARSDRREDRANGAPQRVSIRRRRELIRLLISLILLAVGAEWTVNGSTAIALSLGISEFVIGLTLVAVGTSLPELASSVAAASRKHTDIVIGNIVGSNIINLLLILGVTAVIKDIPMSTEAIRFEFPALIGFSLALGVFFLDARMRRWEGVALLVAYAAFLVLLF